MPKRSSKTKEDVNQLAARIVAQATGNEAIEPESRGLHRVNQKPVKNPAAVALGRLGGLKGGKARAKKLSGKKRSEIALKAATVRWKIYQQSEIKQDGKKEKKGRS